MSLVMRHRVRYHETDAQAYVFNSRYLEIADVAMTEYFRHLDLPYLDLLAMGVDPSVVKAELHFRSPARFEDDLDVSIGCTRVGRSSFDLRTEVQVDGRSIADIVITYVNVDAAAAQSRALPPLVADRLRRDMQDDVEPT